MEGRKEGKREGRKIGRTEGMKLVWKEGREERGNEIGKVGIRCNIHGVN